MGWQRNEWDWVEVVQEAWIFRSGDSLKMILAVGDVDWVVKQGEL